MWVSRSSGAEPIRWRRPRRAVASERVDRSHDLDILVIGSRGYGPLHAVLLGGVSGRVIRDAACPVIVVPRGAKVPLEQLSASRKAVA